jgi:hypothetical protein
MILVLLVGVVALQAWVWRRLRTRVLTGEVTRLGALVRYSGWALLPPVLSVAGFFGMVGLEEVSGAAIVPEAVGRSALPAAVLLLGIGVMGCLSFCVWCTVAWRTAAPRR